MNSIPGSFAADAKFDLVRPATDIRFARHAMDEMLVRALDVFFAIALLLFVMPLMAVVALAVFLADPGPVIFIHRRIGKHGQTFCCFKFRTMVLDAEARLRSLLQSDEAARLEWQRDHKLRNDPRLITVGKFLRMSSLDELPQLFNVLQGDMSLVGPRPIVEAEVERYGHHFARYCSVRPGITGLWQVSGRNDVSYRRRVAMDVKFAQTKSVPLYIWVLVMTVPSVLMSRGSY